MKKVTIQYFAILREQRGIEEEQIETEAATITELYGELKEQHGFSLKQTQLRASVDESIVPWDYQLQGGEEVVFIPPVAGG